jgi:hypothetical protein
LIPFHCNLNIKIVKIIQINEICLSVQMGVGQKKTVLRRLFSSLLQRTRFKRRRVVLSRYLPGW